MHRKYAFSDCKSRNVKNYSQIDLYHESTSIYGRLNTFKYFCTTREK